MGTQLLKLLLLLAVTTLTEAEPSCADFHKKNDCAYAVLDKGLCRWKKKMCVCKKAPCVFPAQGASADVDSSDSASATDVQAAVDAALAPLNARLDALERLLQNVLTAVESLNSRQITVLSPDIIGAVGNSMGFKDIDECLEETDDCEYSCQNEFGSYACGCAPGFELNADDRTCADIDECGDDPCSHTCANTAGSFNCSCPSGFGLMGDGVTCIDINECRLGVCGALQCNNLPGSYECVCDPGFTVQGNPPVCEDIDECAQDPCDQICENSDGSYECKCNRGYNLDADGSTCVDIDECVLGPPRECEFQCINTDGGYECLCPAGYVKEGKYACLNIDECQTSNGGCDHVCQDEEPGTSGGPTHTCSCDNGYTLGVAFGSCVDIDECANNDGGCNVAGGFACVNTDASFECSCPSGYEETGVESWRTAQGYCGRFNDPGWNCPYGGFNSCTFRLFSDMVGTEAQCMAEVDRLGDKVQAWSWTPSSLMCSVYGSDIRFDDQIDEVKATCDCNGIVGSCSPDANPPMCCCESTPCTSDQPGGCGFRFVNYIGNDPFCLGPGCAADMISMQATINGGNGEATTTCSIRTHPECTDIDECADDVCGYDACVNTDGGYNCASATFDSVILNGIVDGKRTLQGFLPASARGGWELAYRATRDGQGVRDWHGKIDDRGTAQFFICKVNTGYTFGHFTSIAWTSAPPDQWQFSPGQFAFRLEGGSGPVKWRPSRADGAMLSMHQDLPPYMRGVGTMGHGHQGTKFNVANFNMKIDLGGSKDYYFIEDANGDLGARMGSSDVTGQQREWYCDELEHFYHPSFELRLPGGGLGRVPVRPNRGKSAGDCPAVNDRPTCITSYTSRFRTWPFDCGWNPSSGTCERGFGWDKAAGQIMNIPMGDDCAGVADISGSQWSDSSFFSADGTYHTDSSGECYYADGVSCTWSQNGNAVSVSAGKLTYALYLGCDYRDTQPDSYWVKPGSVTTIQMTGESAEPNPYFCPSVSGTLWQFGRYNKMFSKYGQFQESTGPCAVGKSGYPCKFTQHGDKVMWRWAGGDRVLELDCDFLSKPGVLSSPFGPSNPYNVGYLGQNCSGADLRGTLPQNDCMCADGKEWGPNCDWIAPYELNKVGNNQGGGLQHPGSTYGCLDLKLGPCAAQCDLKVGCASFTISHVGEDINRSGNCCLKDRKCLVLTAGGALDEGFRGVGAGHTSFYRKGARYPVDCVWDEWSSWDYLATKSCGTQRRTRALLQDGYCGSCLEPDEEMQQGSDCPPFDPNEPGQINSTYGKWKQVLTIGNERNMYGFSSPDCTMTEEYTDAGGNGACHGGMFQNRSDFWDGNSNPIHDYAAGPEVFGKNEVFGDYYTEGAMALLVCSTGANLPDGVPPPCYYQDLDFANPNFRTTATLPPRQTLHQIFKDKVQYEQPPQEMDRLLFREVFGGNAGDCSIDTDFSATKAGCEAGGGVWTYDFSSGLSECEPWGLNLQCGEAAAVRFGHCGNQGYQGCGGSDADFAIGIGAASQGKGRNYGAGMAGATGDIDFRTYLGGHHSSLNVQTKIWVLEVGSPGMVPAPTPPPGPTVDVAFDCPPNDELDCTADWVNYQPDAWSARFIPLGDVCYNGYYSDQRPAGGCAGDDMWDIDYAQNWRMTFQITPKQMWVRGGIFRIRRGQQRLEISTQDDNTLAFSFGAFQVAGTAVIKDGTERLQEDVTYTIELTHTSSNNVSTLVINVENFRGFEDGQYGLGDSAADASWTASNNGSTATVTYSTSKYMLNMTADNFDEDQYGLLQQERLEKLAKGYICGSSSGGVGHFKGVMCKPQINLINSVGGTYP